MNVFFELPEGFNLIESFLTWEQWLFMILIPALVVITITFLIGLERQNVGKAAGISSHVLVGISALMIAIMQRMIFFQEITNGIESPQSQRVIAQVVTGIGFIGAGVIMKDKFTVKGLTTAATIWTTAMIGLILGSGYLIVGSLLGLLVSLFILIRDLNRGINPFRPYKVPNHGVRRYRFISKGDQDDVISEDFHHDEDLPHL